MSEGRADPTAVSRRALIGAPALAAAPASGAGLPTGDIVARGAAFLAVDAEIGRLSGRWGDLEARAAPEDGEMARIDAMLEALFARRSELLDSLRAATAVEPRAAAAKLAVAARVICRDTDARLHGLLDDLARDLAAMRCPHCRARLVR